MYVSEFGIGSLMRIVLLFYVFFIFVSVSILRRKKSNITIATEEQMLLLRALSLLQIKKGNILETSHQQHEVWYGVC